MLKRRNREQRICSIHFDTEILCAVTALQKPGAVPEISQITQLKRDEDLEQQLREFVKQQRQLNIPTLLVLHHQDYDLLRVKKLTVPKKELKNAIAWQIQQRVSLPIDQLIINTFEEPNPKHPELVEHWFTVATPKNILVDKIKLLKRCGLKLERITIAELTLLSLIAEINTAEYAGCILLSQHMNHFISTYKNQLTGSHTIPLPKMTDDQAIDLALLQPVLDELNRLVSYQQQEVGENFKLYCVPTMENFEAWQPLLEKHLDLPPQFISLKPFLRHDFSEDTLALPHTFTAISGAFTDV